MYDIIDFIHCFGFVCFIAGERSRWILNCLSCVVRVFIDLIHGFVFVSLLESVVDGFVCFIAGGRGRWIHWGSFIASGINNRKYFNGTSYDVTGVLGIIQCVTDHSLRQGSTIEPVLTRLISMITNCVYIINGPLAS